MDGDTGSVGSRERTTDPPLLPGDESNEPDTSTGSTSAGGGGGRNTSTSGTGTRTGSTRLRNRPAGNSISSAGGASSAKDGNPTTAATGTGRPARSTSVQRGSAKPPSNGPGANKKRTASGTSKDGAPTGPGKRVGALSSKRAKPGSSSTGGDDDLGPDEDDDRPLQHHPRGNRGKPSTAPALDEDGEEDEDDDGEDGSVTRCVCRRNGEDAATGLMFQCESCNVWQHGPCVGLNGDIVGDYYCERCRPDLHINGQFQTRARPSAPPSHRRSPSTSYSHSHSLSTSTRRERQATQDAVKLSKFLEEAGVPVEEMSELGGFAMPIAHTRRATMDAAKSAAGGPTGRDVFAGLGGTAKSERERDSVSADVHSEFGSAVGPGHRHRSKSKSAKDKSPSPAGSWIGQARVEARIKRKRASEDGEQTSPQSVESPLAGTKMLEKGKRRRVSPPLHSNSGTPLMDPLSLVRTDSNGGDADLPAAEGSPAGSVDGTGAPLGPSPLTAPAVVRTGSSGGSAGNGGNASSGSNASGGEGSNNGQSMPRKASAPVITTAPMVTAPTSKPKHPNQYTYRPLDPNRKKDVVIKKVSPTKKMGGPGGGTYSGSSGTGSAVNGANGAHSGAAAALSGVATSVATPTESRGGGGGGRGKAHRERHQHDRETTPLDGGGWGMPEFLSHLAHLLPGPSPKPIAVPVPKSTVKKAAQAAAAAMAMAEEDESGIEPMVIDSVNGQALHSANGAENGLTAVVAAELPTQLEAGCKVRFPGKRMTMPDMRKRAKHLADYIARIQADQVDVKRRNRVLEGAGWGAGMAKGVEAETVRLMEELGGEIQSWQARFGA